MLTVPCGRMQLKTAARPLARTLPMPKLSSGRMPFGTYIVSPSYSRIIVWGEQHERQHVVTLEVVKHPVNEGRSGEELPYSRGTIERTRYAAQGGSFAFVRGSLHWMLH